nr:MAG TPA: hypothetical protein [Caudoviricetes sp.]
MLLCQSKSEASGRASGISGAPLSCARDIREGVFFGEVNGE